MKRLFVVRHAKSSWDFPELDDHDRPLNKRGLKNAPEMGRRLARKNLKADLIVTSTATRAAHTAKIVADELSYSKSKISEDPQLYHASIPDIMACIQSTRNEVMTLIIFGHNPGFTDFVNYLTDSEIYNIPTCGVAEINFDVAVWGQVGKGLGRLISMDYPKKAF